MVIIIVDISKVYKQIYLFAQPVLAHLVVHTIIVITTKSPLNTLLNLSVLLIYYYFDNDFLLMVFSSFKITSTGMLHGR